MKSVAPKQPPAADAPADVPWLADHVDPMLENISEAIDELGRDLVGVVFEGDPRGMFCRRVDALRVARLRGIPARVISPMTSPAPAGSIFVLALGAAHGAALALLHVVPMQGVGVA